MIIRFYEDVDDRVLRALVIIRFYKDNNGIRVLRTSVIIRFQGR